ncbi:MAG TPA: hypothetical protein VLF89_07960, partial [Candidatus Saccharimonadales bacterium]|nr:hypothetical protein [Candidatus Saccharimonadales bacterium]
SITMLHNGLTGIFVHKLPENNAQVWNELSEETQNVIPIAPILRLGPKIQDTRIIASRYCGVSVKDVFSILNLNLGNPKERIKGRNPMTVEFAIADMYYSSRHPLIKDIVTQVSNTLAFLEEKRIDHIHPHWENFVIELIDEDYLTNYFLENPNETINTVPYREDAFSFDILQFNEITNQGKKKWKTVVRLIDFDLATHIFDKDPKNK